MPSIYQKYRKSTFKNTAPWRGSVKRLNSGSCMRMAHLHPASPSGIRFLFITRGFKTKFSLKKYFLFVLFFCIKGCTEQGRSKKASSFSIGVTAVLDLGWRLIALCCPAGKILYALCKGRIWHREINISCGCRAQECKYLLRVWETFYPSAKQEPSTVQEDRETWDMVWLDLWMQRDCDSEIKRTWNLQSEVLGSVMLLRELNSLIRAFQMLPAVEGGHSTLGLSGNI